MCKFNYSCRTPRGGRIVRSPSTLSRHQPMPPEFPPNVNHEPATCSEIQDDNLANLDILESQDSGESNVPRSGRAWQTPRLMLSHLRKRREEGRTLATKQNADVISRSESHDSKDNNAPTGSREEIVKTEGTGDYCFLCFASDKDFAMKVAVECPKWRSLVIPVRKVPTCEESWVRNCTIRSKTSEGSDEVAFAQVRKAAFQAYGRWKTWIPY